MHPQVTNNRPEHAMLAAFASDLPVRLGSITNTQGMRNALPIFVSPNPCTHACHCLPHCDGDHDDFNRTFTVQRLCRH